MKAEDWICPVCGVNLWGYVSVLIGRKKKDRKLHCLKCFEPLPKPLRATERRLNRKKEVTV